MSINSGPNPFQAGPAIREPARFAGRTKILQKVSEAMSILQNLSLEGERRTGKTSLLLYLANPVGDITLPEKHVPVYLDFQKFSGTGTAAIWKALAKAINEQIIQRYPDQEDKAKQFLSIFEDTYEFSDEMHSIVIGFAQGVKYLDDTGFKLNLLFDEFEYTKEIKDLDDSFYDVLRALPTEVKNISYVIATRTGLADLQSKNKVSSPFFNIFVKETLTPFEKVEVYRLIRSYFDQAGMDSSLAQKLLDQLSFLYDYTGYHPFFLQALCRRLFETLDTPDWTLDQVQKQVIQAFAQDAEEQFEKYWEYSSEEEQKLIKELADDYRSVSWEQATTNPLINRLKDRCLVVQAAETNKWRLFSPVFGEWINNNTNFFPGIFLNRLPYPIAVVCAQYNQAKTRQERFQALDKLITNVAKYLTALALSQYWQDKPDTEHLRTWLGSLNAECLKTSLAVFDQINTHYQAISEKPYLFPFLFEPCIAPVEDGSTIAKVHEEIRKLRRHKRSQEDITLQKFLSQLLDYREKKWEFDIDGVDVNIRDQLLLNLPSALTELLSTFTALFSHPLRYIERIDKSGEEWVYTTIEYLGAESESSVPNDLFRETGVTQPSYSPRRLYLCQPNGHPYLNLHPFLILYLYKMYFLEQASDRSNMWYQHCASPERFQPPEHVRSLILSTSQFREDASLPDDPVSQLEQANNSLHDEEVYERFNEMPLSILLTHLSSEGREALELALGEALRIGRFWLGAEFLLMGVSRQNNGIFTILLREIGLHSGELRGALRGMAGIASNQDWRRQNVAELGNKALPQLQITDSNQLRQILARGDTPTPIITPRMLKILKDAAKTAGEDQISHSHLLLAACRQSQALAMQLFFSVTYQAGWSPDQVISRLAELAQIPPEDLIIENKLSAEPPQVRRPDQMDAKPHPLRQASVLNEFGRDLTKAAADGHLHPAVGESAHQAIIQIGRILLQREANNPILVGDSGVGKTAVVEGFAWRLQDQTRPVASQLAGRQIIELSANILTSGTKYRGDLEERLRSLLVEVKAANGQTIVFIDELHTILKGNSNESIADALKPALARGEFPCIGATTVADYRQYIEKDPALARRFTPIWLEEPTVEEAIKIVQVVATGRLAVHHQVNFDSQAIAAAVRLSARYIHDERLPGKAIKLLDEAASGLRVPASLYHEDEAETFGQDGRSVSVEDVIDIIARRTSIPVTQLGKTDKERLLELEERLRAWIIGQSEAIAQVVRVIKRAGAGLNDARRPLGIFLFAGPTGVGKTELALALAEALFDQEEAIFRLDMSEFMEKHQVARLTGAPPGYVGYDVEGQLTGRLRRYPYSVILLDEIEKAHFDVQHLFLQLFDNGRLTDSQGRLADGRKAVFIMTTNLGAREALGMAGKTKAFQEKLLSAINDHFTMEFMNRIDRVVYFNPLDEAALSDIFDRELRPFQWKLQQEYRVTITVPIEIKDRIVHQIVQQKFGARPLRRYIEDKIIAPLVDKLLAGDYKPGTRVVLGREIDFGTPPPSNPPVFDLGRIGPVPPSILKTSRPTTPEAGLPQLDNIEHEHQAVFDECFLALARRLAEKNIALEIDRLAKYFLCAPQAADQKPREGRSIEQAFDDLIEQPITDQLLAEELKAGDWIKLDYSPDGPVIKKLEGGA